MNNEVYVLSYNTLEKWSDRKKAMSFYRTGISCSDGSEKERYTEIYLQLQENYKYVDDGKSNNILRKKFHIKTRSELANICKGYRCSREEILSASQI